MSKSSRQIRDEFDRIALASAPADEGSHPYDRMLVSLIPPACRRLLDLGCGTGRLTRAMAQHVEHVTAVDVSPEMLRVAREHCAALGNIAFVEADLLNLPAALGPFDCVICVNVLHHFPAADAVEAMKAVLAPGGVLIVHDVRQSAGAFDRLLDGPRVAVKAAWRLTRVGRVRAFLRQRAAWAQHARGEIILTADEIAGLRDRVLPGAVIRQHFLWRYTLVWIDDVPA
jgi:ubiquinone/menaquinone biosynthesis C-methylase UbiE